MQPADEGHRLWHRRSRGRNWIRERRQLQISCGSNSLRHCRKSYFNTSRAMRVRVQQEKRENSFLVLRLIGAAHLTLQEKPNKPLAEFFAKTELFSGFAF